MAQEPKLNKGQCVYWNQCVILVVPGCRDSDMNEWSAQKLEVGEAAPALLRDLAEDKVGVGTQVAGQMMLALNPTASDTWAVAVGLIQQGLAVHKP